MAVLPYRNNKLLEITIDNKITFPFIFSNDSSIPCVINIYTSANIVVKIQILCKSDLKFVAATNWTRSRDLLIKLAKVR